MAKHARRVEAYGSVDETNATLGLARLHAEGEADAALARIQNDLFDLGADLCRPEPQGEGGDGPLRVAASQVARLEDEIDRLNAGLAPLESFVLPGGNAAAADLHFARTVVRRAEREATLLAESEPINPEALRYLNRLSDLLFVLARQANDGGAGDVLWTPGKHR